jgi:hypothetical protein
VPPIGHQLSLNHTSVIERPGAENAILETEIFDVIDDVADADVHKTILICPLYNPSLIVSDAVPVFEIVVILVILLIVPLPAIVCTVPPNTICPLNLVIVLGRFPSNVEILSFLSEEFCDRYNKSAALTVVAAVISSSFVSAMCYYGAAVVVVVGAAVVVVVV